MKKNYFALTLVTVITCSRSAQIEKKYIIIYKNMNALNFTENNTSYSTKNRPLEQIFFCQR